ncbi:MAG: tetratricopeptide repeat protein [Bacteroidota bacterium]
MVICKNKIKLFALVFSISIIGCSYLPNAVNEKINFYYTSFVSYFNTFYNARELYNSANLEVIKIREDAIKQNKSFSISSLSSASKDKFQKSIEKASKFLTYYPNSAFVSDALVLIGKSTFLLGDISKAQKKCNEILERYPNSEIAHEINILQIKILIEQKDFVKATESFENIINEEIYLENKDFNSELILITNDLYFKRNKFQDCQLALNKIVKFSSNKFYKSFAYFLIAKCYENANEIPNSVSTFLLASETADDYSQKILYLTNYYRINEDYKKSISELNELIELDKNKTFIPDLYLTIGKIYFKAKNFENAKSYFKMLDTSFATSPQANEGKYYSGEIYFKIENKIDTAILFYEKVKTAAVLNDFTIDAIKKYKYLFTYSRLMKEKNNYLSLILKNDSLVSAQKIVLKIKLHRANDSLRFMINKTIYDLANFFHLDESDFDSAKVYYSISLKNATTDEEKSKIIFSLADIYRVEDTTLTKSDSLYKILINNYSASVYADKAREFLKISKIDETSEAQKLFYKYETYLSKNKYDSANVILKNIISKYPNDPIIPKIYFSQAYLYQKHLKKNDLALENYKILSEKYPLSEFAIKTNKYLFKSDSVSVIAKPKIDSLKQTNLKIKKEDDVIPNNSNETIKKPIED